ncbi:MAG: SBBP repeat-containing protein [Promethearchaeota archaeon]
MNSYTIFIGDDNNNIKSIRFKSPALSADFLNIKIWGYYDSDDICEESDVDISTGNLFVVGATNKFGTYDILLLKFDNKGNLLRNVTWDNGKDDYGMDVAINQNTGDVYVIGYSNSSFNNYDIVLIKFNSDCDEQWNLTLGNTTINDYGYGIAVDSSNNIIFTGNSNYDIIIAKYNSSGDQKWIKFWGGSGNDKGFDITTDSDDNIYVTGTDAYSIPMPNSMALLKYNNTGDLQWEKEKTGLSAITGYGVALDSQGYIYLTGRHSLVPTQMYLAKYEDLGTVANEISTKYYSLGNDDYYGKDIILDQHNYLYIASYRRDPNISLCFTLFTTSLDKEHIGSYNGSGIHVKEARSVIIDPNNCLYNSGIITNSSSHLNDIIIAKYDLSAENGGEEDKGDDDDSSGDENVGSFYIIFIILIGIGVAVAVGAIIYIKFVSKRKIEN